jgi:hypothetical protein
MTPMSAPHPDVVVPAAAARRRLEHLDAVPVWVRRQLRDVPVSVMASWTSPGHGHMYAK